MQRAAKVAKVQAVLDELHPDPPIPLDHHDAFTLLVAVMLSAQTTDVRVNLVTPALFAAARTPAAMAELGAEKILALIRTCGLAPAKSKNLERLSQLIVERHAGRVPRTFEELEALPGVGHKTASVVMAQAFGEPTFPVDTHIHRLAARWGLSDGHDVARTERDLKAFFPRETWNKVHLQMIWFGRTHCPALRHDGARCPICSWITADARTTDADTQAASLPAAREAASQKTTQKTTQKTAKKLTKKATHTAPKRAPRSASKRAPPRTPRRARDA